MDERVGSGLKGAAREEEQVSGELPCTVHGQPSYSLAKTLVTKELLDPLAATQERYGLTDLEMADVLSEIARGFLRDAVRGQQKRSGARKGAAGMPRWEEYERAGHSAHSSRSGVCGPCAAGHVHGGALHLPPGQFGEHPLQPLDELRVRFRLGEAGDLGFQCGHAILKAAGGFGVQCR